MQVRAKCIGGRPLALGLVLVVLLLVTILGPAWGQDSAKKLVSLDFVAADIHDVLKALSIQSGVNVVAGKDVKGDVTISLANVSLSEALDYVTKVSGLSYQYTGNAYIVGPETMLRSMFGTKDLMTEVIPIPNGQAAQTQVVAAKAIPSATIQAQGDKALVVVGTPTDIEKVKDFVQKISSAIAVESEVTETYRVRYADPKSAVASLTKLVPEVKAAVGPDYGFGWYVKSSNGSSSGGDDDKPKLDSDIIVMTGTPTVIAAAREALAKIDVSPTMIMVEAKVAIIDRNNLKNVGLNWDWTPFSMNEYNFVPEKGDRHNPDIQLGAKVGPLYHSALGFGAQLNALLSNGNTKILASPKVATISNRAAGIFIGDTILYPVTTVSQGVATVTVNSIDVGISLKLAGIVNDDGHITMSVSTYVSTIRDYLKVGDSMFPQVSTRQAQTAIRVKDGEAFLIGGLLRDEDIKNIKKLPLLGNIPIVGNLFRDISHTNSQTELMVFITPHVMKDDQPIQATLPAEFNEKQPDAKQPVAAK